MTEWGLDKRQIATIEAIVCVVESGRTDKYNAIATIKGDRGGLSYGRHQASLNSGNLHKLIAGYCGAPGAAFGAELQAYLPDLAAKNARLNEDAKIKSILRSAGNDPVMCDVQDEFFYQEFMVPALKVWKDYGFQHALSAAVIYDSFIHGSFERIAKAATAVAGEPTRDNEKRWTNAYLDERWKWLKYNSNEILRNTAIRIEALQGLAKADNWSLRLPFNLARPSSAYPLTAYDLPASLFRRDGRLPLQRCEPQEFGTAQPRAKSKAAAGNQRDIFIQRCLILTGHLKGVADGDFGAGTKAAVEKFQKDHGLKVTGVVGPEDFIRLCQEAEEIETLTGPAPGLPDAGLKPATEPARKPVTATGAAGTVIAGAGAAGAAVVAGETAAGAADEANTSTAETSAAETGPALPPAAETPESAAVETGAAAGTAPPPAATGTPAGAQPGASEQPPPAPLPPASPPETAQTTGLCQRPDPFLDLQFCKLSKTDTFTVGAIGLFVLAVLLVSVGRRVFDRGDT